MDDREHTLGDPELAAAAREGFEGNGPARAYALGYAAGAKVRKATPEGFVVDITGTGGMSPQEFVRTVDDAVKRFLEDPRPAGDKVRLAALRGDENDPAVRTYASGYAAGRVAATEEYAMQGTGAAALVGLKEWIENRRARFAAGSLDLDDLVAEIDARLVGGGEVP